MTEALEHEDTRLDKPGVFCIHASACLVDVSYVHVQAPTAEQALALLKSVLENDEHPAHKTAMAAITDNSAGCLPLKPVDVDFYDVDFFSDDLREAQWPEEPEGEG